MTEEKKTYGNLTVGYGTSEQRTIPIVEYVAAIYKDERKVSIARSEEDTYVISVDNYASSGRGSHSINLSKESLIGVLTTGFMFLGVKGENIEQLLKDSMEGEEINYSFSDNLKPLQP